MLTSPPPGDARQDWWITQAIAQKMGLDWSYLHPRDVFNEMAQVMPSLKNITYERLENENSVTYPCDDPNKPGNEIIFNEKFPTANGRGKIVPARLIPPAELPDDDFPMILTTGRLLEHWHTGSMTTQIAKGKRFSLFHWIIAAFRNRAIRTVFF